MAAAGSFVLKLAGFVSFLAAKESKAMPILSKVEAQLSLHKRNIAKAAPEAQE